MDRIDERTPVLIGVGQVIDRLDGDGYEALSPVDLAARASARALADTGVDAAVVAAAIDTVVMDGGRLRALSQIPRELLIID